MSNCKLIPIFALAMALVMVAPASAKSAVKTPGTGIVSPVQYRKLNVREASYSIADWILIRPIIVVPNFSHSSVIELE